MAKVLVFAESRDGKLKKVALECLSEGRRLAAATSGSLHALVIGGNLAGVADALKPYGADEILVVSDPRLELYAPIAYARAAQEAVTSSRAETGLPPPTALGKDLSARPARRPSTRARPHCASLGAGG